MNMKIIERHVLARQAAEKAKAAPDADLAAVVKRAVNEALAEAGVVTTRTPAPQPPQSPRITRWTRPARTYAPPPDHAPQAWREPAPLPLVVPPPAAAAPGQQSKQLMRVQRDELGLLKSVHVEPGGPTFTVQRDSLGRIDLLLIDGKPTQRWLYGVDGETVVGAVPANHPPTRYNGRAVPPAAINRGK